MARINQFSRSITETIKVQLMQIYGSLDLFILIFHKHNSTIHNSTKQEVSHEVQTFVFPNSADPIV